jgi:hypothetical protein
MNYRQFETAHQMPRTGPGVASGTAALTGLASGPLPPSSERVRLLERRALGSEEVLEAETG